MGTNPHLWWFSKFACEKPTGIEENVISTTLRPSLLASKRRGISRRGPSQGKGVSQRGRAGWYLPVNSYMIMETEHFSWENSLLRLGHFQ